MNSTIKKSSESIAKLRRAVQALESVQGLTHTFYRYPARFSPRFVREVIKTFSKPGDVILDPFVGGGTTLVEALMNNRHSIGFDVSPIAHFVTKTKTTLLNDRELVEVYSWAQYILTKNLSGHHHETTHYEDEGYLNNLPWRIRSSVEIILAEVDLLRNERQRNFAKCCVLKTAQWALDCKKTVPTADRFREKFSENILSFVNSASEFSQLVNRKMNGNRLPFCICLNESSENIGFAPHLQLLPSKPKLVITSPPYVGVHMNYHQWQVNSRKRTRAPFWIINSLDGHGSSFYTFGHYKSHVKDKYFEVAEKVFSSIYSSIHEDALVVQLVGFSDHKRYLNKYLKMMEAAGYEEVHLKSDSLNRVKRIWRSVPNRKWYANSQTDISSSKEVLLIHRKK